MNIICIYYLRFKRREREREEKREREKRRERVRVCETNVVGIPFGKSDVFLLVDEYFFDLTQYFLNIKFIQIVNKYTIT